VPRFACLCGRQIDPVARSRLIDPSEEQLALKNESSLHLAQQLP
jgi:hypothetical protein